MPQFITDGATMQCNKGTLKSALAVTSQTGCLIEGKPQATEKDKQAGENIPPFGKCAITKKQCSPQLQSWEKIGPFTIDGISELTTDSFCTCSKGGKITFTEAGQSGFVKLKN